MKRRRVMEDRSPTEIIKAHQQRVKEMGCEELIALGPGETSLHLLQRIYRDVAQPLSVRLRAAIESLPYENPKLSAVAVTAMSANDFAAASMQRLSGVTARS